MTESAVKVSGMNMPKMKVSEMKVSGMKVSEFKKQFNSEINVSLNNNALVANGAKFKFNNTPHTA